MARGSAQDHGRLPQLNLTCIADHRQQAVLRLATDFVTFGVSARSKYKRS
jgi:hypothetical protein